MRGNYPSIIAGLLLTTITVTVYWQVFNNGFINFDDNLYITGNAYVQSGLDIKSIRWAFFSTYASNWHPLTWLSHMLDYQLYGLNPIGHHFTSLLFHIINVLLLFFLLKRMTGAFWQSAIVSALFATHPLNVESVVWVAERKNVLSSCFWMLTIWTYFSYTQNRCIKRYLLVLIVFILGLMSKPMLVTLPFVLLLLDYWPLGRFQQRYSPNNSDLPSREFIDSKGIVFVVIRLIKEKIPLFIFSVVFSLVTFFVQQRGEAVKTLELFPLNIRITNAIISYISYLKKMVWPLHLAIMYPHPGRLQVWQAAGAGMLLIFLSALVILLIRKYPYLIVGWFWYLGTLVLVIGLVQVGFQSMADRYTYIPLIGIYIIIAWGIPDLVARWRNRKVILNIFAGILILFFSICTWFQVSYWKNSITIFQHALIATDNNSTAHNNLGIALVKQRKSMEALAHFSEAVRIRPDYAIAHSNLGTTLLEMGKLNEANDHYFEVLKIKPDDANAHYNIGIVLFRQNKNTEAIRHFLKALQIKPDDANVHNNLGVAFTREGKLNEAIAHFSRALEIKPGYAGARNNLEISLKKQRKQGELVNK